MKRSLKELISYKLSTKDGSNASIIDFLFDEDAWVLRYLEADFGNFFKDKRVLIPKVFLEEPDWEKKHFALDINKDEFNKFPPLEKHMPVSREYETKLRQYFNIDYYWMQANTSNIDVGLFPPRPLIPPAKSVKDDDIKSKLRSFNEVEGYRIKASDGTIGHVEDLIVDDADWQIVYLIVDTKNWLPWSKKVVLSLGWLDEINYPDQQVSINLKVDAIKNAPDYDDLELNSKETEKVMFDFYSRSMVK